MEIVSKRYLKKLLVSFSVISFFLCFSFISDFYSFAATITYKYDSLNRLTDVQYSNGTTIEYVYDATGNILTKKVSLAAECTECSASPVVLKNVTFNSGTTCECRDNSSITIGTGVIIKNGANITFKAPIVKILVGFHAERGSVVNVKQQ